MGAKNVRLVTKATHPQLFLIPEGVAVTVTLRLKGRDVWSSRVHVAGWFQILVCPSDSAVRELLPVRVECDTLCVSVAGRVLLKSDFVGHVESFSIDRHPVVFSPMEFCYMTLAHCQNRPCTVEQDDDHLYHLSTDELGFLLVRRQQMDRFVERLDTHLSLLERFTTTEDGNDLMRLGAVCPVLGIHAWTYRIAVGTARVSAWAGPLVARRGPYNCGAPGNLELMLGRGLEKWPGASLPLEADLAWFDIDVHSTGPAGEGVGTYVLRPRRRSDHGVADPMINEDPGVLFEEAKVDIDGVWIPS